MPGTVSNNSEREAAQAVAATGEAANTTDRRRRKRTVQIKGPSKPTVRTSKVAKLSVQATRMARQIELPYRITKLPDRTNRILQSPADLKEEIYQFFYGMNYKLYY